MNGEIMPELGQFSYYLRQIGRIFQLIDELTSKAGVKYPAN